MVVTLEKKVDERTKELKQAKEQTEKLVEKLRKANEEIQKLRPHRFTRLTLAACQPERLLT